MFPQEIFSLVLFYSTLYTITMCFQKWDNSTIPFSRNESDHFREMRFSENGYQVLSRVGTRWVYYNTIHLVGVGRGSLVLFRSRKFFVPGSFHLPLPFYSVYLDAYIKSKINFYFRINWAFLPCMYILYKCFCTHDYKVCVRVCISYPIQIDG